jgi:hypothetical protein
MKTDALTLTVVSAIVISIVTAGVVVLIMQNDLTRIPSAERGLIVSKNVINANDSVIELSDGKILHILNNTPLYLSLQENQSYVFNCLYNHNTQITVIETAQNDTSAST